MAITESVKLDINGSTQEIRLCAERAGLPPLLIVQAGPGLPLLHEVRKFQRRLQLEKDFLVSYWEQRGCGNATQQDAKSVSLLQQVEDLRAILKWLHNETKQTAIVLGISLGATILLRAVEHEPDKVKSVIAISPDANTAGSDASVYSFLQEQSVLAGGRRLSGRVKKLGRPPYTDSAAFQRPRQLVGRPGYDRTRQEIQCDLEGNAIWHDPDLWLGWYRQSPAQYESDPAQAAAGVGVIRLVCPSTTFSGPCSLRFR